MGLWKDSYNGKVASAYQDVIDSLDNRDMTGEIREAFDKYVDMVDALEAKLKSIKEDRDFWEKEAMEEEEINPW